MALPGVGLGEPRSVRNGIVSKETSYMGLRVNTNVASLNAQRNLFNATSRLQGNFSRLSSGLRIATAADDAAGLGISERMRSQIRSLGVAARNAHLRPRTRASRGDPRASECGRRPERARGVPPASFAS